MYRLSPYPYLGLFTEISGARRNAVAYYCIHAGKDLNDRQSISIAVLSARQDDVELVNRTLRDAGHAAHCHWVQTPNTLDSTLESQLVELIIVNKDSYADSIKQVIERLKAEFPEHRESAGQLTLRTDGGRIETTWTWQHVKAELHEASDIDRQRLVAVLEEFGCQTFEG